MKRSFLIAMLAAAYFLSAGTSFAQKSKLKVPQRVTVLDSKGKTLGDVVGNSWSQAFAILLETSGVVFEIVPIRSGYLQHDIYFESTDCSGTPLTPHAPDNLVSVALVGPPGNTVYVPDPNASPQNLTIRSRRRGGSCFPGLLGGFPPVVPAIALIDLDTEFTPPFSLRRAP